MAASTDLPVSADFENGFADEPAEVANTVRMALEAGLAGCSIEDATGDDEGPAIYDPGTAAARIEAAAEVAHGGTVQLVLTARAENYLHGRPDLRDTIRRLRPTRTPAPTSSTPLACTASTTFATSSQPSTGR